MPLGHRACDFDFYVYARLERSSMIWFPVTVELEVLNDKKLLSNFNSTRNIVRQFDASVFLCRPKVGNFLFRSFGKFASGNSKEDNFTT